MEHKHFQRYLRDLASVSLAPLTGVAPGKGWSMTFPGSRIDLFELPGPRVVIAGAGPKNGMISDTGYDLAWFRRARGTYLAGKFLAPDVWTMERALYDFDGLLKDRPLSDGDLVDRVRRAITDGLVEEMRDAIEDLWPGLETESLPGWGFMPQHKALLQALSVRFDALLAEREKMESFRCELREHAFTMNDTGVPDILALRARFAVEIAEETGKNEAACWRAGDVVIGAWRDKRAIGYAQAYIVHDDYVMLEQVYVVPEARRSGVAFRLICAALEKFPAHDVFAEALPGRERLLERAGLTRDPRGLVLMRREAR